MPHVIELAQSFVDNFRFFVAPMETEMSAVLRGLEEDPDSYPAPEITTLIRTRKVIASAAISRTGAIGACTGIRKSDLTRNRSSFASVSIRRRMPSQPSPSRRAATSPGSATLLCEPLWSTGRFKAAGIGGRSRLRIRRSIALRRSRKLRPPSPRPPHKLLRRFLG